MPAERAVPMGLLLDPSLRILLSHDPVCSDNTGSRVGCVSAQPKYSTQAVSQWLSGGVYVVEALRECFGDDTVRTNPHKMDSHVRSWTGGMQIKTLDLAPARSTRRRSSNRNRLPDIPLLDHEAAESVTEATEVVR